MNETIPLTEKYCTGCKQVKDLKEFKKDSSKKSGFHYKCKNCENWREGHPKRYKEVLLDGFKRCSRCEQVKEHEKFYPTNRNKDGRFSHCIECDRKIDKRTYEDYRAAKIKQKYKITTQQYEEMFERQNGACASCKKPETTIQRGKVIKLAIDHCHKTGKVRSLLCGRCNSSLGILREDPAMIESLADYIDCVKGGNIPIFASQESIRKFPDTVVEKYCHCCEKVKVVRDFGKNMDAYDNLTSICKMCIKWRKTHPAGKEVFKDGEKRCPACKEIKGLDKFYNYKNGIQGKMSRCIPCLKKAPWSNPEMVRGSQLKRLYGITTQQYNALLQEQNFACASCKQPETIVNHGKTDPLAVDHCHRTKVVRGLLCARCNRSLGYMQEDSKAIRKLAEYAKAIAA